VQLAMQESNVPNEAGVRPLLRIVALSPQRRRPSALALGSSLQGFCLGFLALQYVVTGHNESRPRRKRYT
jgi:hypothetical protein